MKYAVDRIDNEVATLESIIDGSKINIMIKDISFDIKEGDILVFDGEKYFKDDKLKNERIKSIREKMKQSVCTLGTDGFLFLIAESRMFRPTPVPSTRWSIRIPEPPPPDERTSCREPRRANA